MKVTYAHNFPEKSLLDETRTTGRWLIIGGDHWFIKLNVSRHFIGLHIMTFDNKRGVVIQKTATGWHWLRYRGD